VISSAMKPGVAVIAATLLVFLFGPALARAQKPTTEDCLACHGDTSLTKEVNGKPVSLYVNPDSFKVSMHGSMFTCVDCHTDVKTSPHENTPAKISCATCHGEQQAAYDRSFHAKARKNGDLRAATCADCHGSPHELLATGDPKSRTSHANIPATCGACHGQKFVMEPSGQGTQPYLSYQASVHGQAVAKGVEKAAVCTDCHGSHEILGAGDPKSSIFKFNVPKTCGTCHGPVQQAFDQSIHGQAIARGQWQAPVCTDCHGIHSIQSHKDADSPVSATNLAQETCARCHEGVRLSREFGFEGARISTYLASYHGLASRRGSTVVANCASCHGVHNILPSSDARSTTNPANLVKTCGHCHVGATAGFVIARVHVNAPFSSDKGSKGVRWIRGIYLVLIVGVVGGMLAHNAIVWRFKAMARRSPYSTRTVVRMTRNQRVQHNLLFISFTVLVVTGFGLKYPDSWWSYLLLGISESTRRLVHRVAGAVLIGVSLYHAGYLVLTEEGRSMLRQIWVRWRDPSDFWRSLRYYLGLGTTRPQFGRFTYAEKVEYWALIWGTIVMAVTGVMLWGKVIVGNHLPRWWLDVATAIHFYEAILASLAIVVWHFYQVFFDPDAYPMNWAWWDGQVSVEHYRAEHPLDLEALLERRPASNESGAGKGTHVNEAPDASNDESQEKSNGS
jgi:cytochrome b subunit of formate dehydrogenase